MLASAAARGLEPSSHRRWTDLVLQLRDNDVEQIIWANWNTILDDARLANVLPRTLEIQVRLHIPSIGRETLRSWHPAKIYEQVRLPALLRAFAMRRTEEDAQLRANSSLFVKPRKVRRDLVVELADGQVVRLEFRRVSPKMGNMIQKDLHYLRSPRGDTYREYGIFLPGADFPITYVAFSPCDRPHINQCIAALPGLANTTRNLVLTRMYSLPQMPRNLISLTLRHAARRIRAEQEYLTISTSFNPLLGFSGAAFHASGFVPVARSPVTYSYQSNGQYATRRQSGQCRAQPLDTPPNLLAVKGVTRSAQRGLLYSPTMTSVSDADYETSALPDPAGLQNRQQTPVMEYEELVLMRKTLEFAWSDSTIHPSYLPRSTDSTTTSRGQCGVSSVFLLNELRNRGQSCVTYCYGDVEFEDEDMPPLRHHCWVEVGNQEGTDTYVVDLTGDQTQALGQRVVLDTWQQLKNAGIWYKAQSRSTIDQLPTDRVWPRYLELRDALDL